MNGKKKWSKILLIFGVLIGVVGVSYALWRASFSSTNDNSLTATCFNVSFTDQNNISIEKAYPLLDKDGKKLTPYTFTITNNCDTYASYDINLEVLNSSTLTNMNYIKMSLDDDILSLISSLDVTTKTLSNASSAYKISTGYLNAKESKTYNLRLWLDENVTGETKGVQNNTFTSKITVNASYMTEEPKQTVVDYVTTLAGTDTTNLVEDDYENIRYIGKDPNNYVSFDGDIWRIIGVMNNIDNGNNKKEKRVKIIRNESIGNYSWDTSDSSANGGYGINEWSQADLMKLLNPGYESEMVGGSLYWNNKSGKCYVDENNGTEDCNFTNTGIKEKLKNMIGNAVWNTGSNGSSYSFYATKTAKFYELERSNNTGKICTSGTYCNDTIERTTTWTGKIGLMYPSDYGYATSGGSQVYRKTCLNKELYNWNNGNISDCKNNDWLFNRSDSQWTLSPFAFSSSDASNAFSGCGGSIDYDNVYLTNIVAPVGYLLSNVKISSGTGTSDDPYILSL